MNIYSYDNYVLILFNKIQDKIENDKKIMQFPFLLTAIFKE